MFVGTLTKPVIKFTWYFNSTSAEDCTVKASQVRGEEKIKQLSHINVRLETIYFAQEIKVAPLLTAGAIWYVALMVCCKQLQPVFSHQWTQQQLLSVIGLFTPSIHILWVCPFRLSSWAGQVILFNYTYSPMWLPESFILWSTGEFTDGFGIQLTKMKNMNADPSKCLFFFLAATAQGNQHWAKNKWEPEEKGYVTKCTMGNLWNRLRSLNPGKKMKNLKIWDV